MVIFEHMTTNTSPSSSNNKRTVEDYQRLSIIQDDTINKMQAEKIELQKKMDELKAQTETIEVTVRKNQYQRGSRFHVTEKFLQKYPVHIAEDFLSNLEMGAEEEEKKSSSGTKRPNQETPDQVHQKKLKDGHVPNDTPSQEKAYISRLLSLTEKDREQNFDAHAKYLEAKQKWEQNNGE